MPEELEAHSDLDQAGFTVLVPQYLNLDHIQLPLLSGSMIQT
jgi:hypothetical protein